MSPQYAFSGGLTIDNVFTADGAIMPRVCGGNAMFAALGASLWGVSVGIMSRAGHDYPAGCLERLDRAGVDLEGVRWVGAPHGMNVAFWYRDDGSRSRAFPPEVTERIPEEHRDRFIDYTTKGSEHRYATWFAFSPQPDDVPSSWISQLRGVHLAAMPVQHHAALASYLRHAKRDLLLTVDSPWYDERDLKNRFEPELFPVLDALIPSEADLAPRFPAASPEAAGRRLLAEDLAAVVIKLGGRGSLVFDKETERTWRIPAYPAKVRDLTGAGDAFCGGFLVGLDRTGDLVQAATYGTVSASFAVETVGPLSLLNVDPATAEARKRHVETHIQPAQGASS